MLTDIAVDAMGSDKAPDPEICGSILACQTLPVRVHLVGPEVELRLQLRRTLEAQGLSEGGAADLDRTGFRADRHGRKSRRRRAP